VVKLDEVVAMSSRSFNALPIVDNVFVVDVRVRVVVAP